VGTAPKKRSSRDFSANISEGRQRELQETEALTWKTKTAIGRRLGEEGGGSGKWGSFGGGGGNGS